MNNFLLNPAHPASPLNPMHPIHPVHRMVFDTITEVPAKDTVAVESKVYSEDAFVFAIIIALIGGFILGKFIS